MGTVTHPDPTDPRPRTVHVQRVMGTAVSFDLRGPGDHEAAIRAATDWFADVDRRFSTYRADSEVSRYARGELDGSAVSADVAEVLEACERLHRVSGGAFDARAGGGFDPSAYVKGWSVQRAADLLRAHGCTDWSVNAGGDVLVASSDPMRSPWRIGIRHPFDADAVAMVVEAHDLAVATSGRYERGDHIVDPARGTAGVDAVSTTVCGPDLGLADAFATAAFVLGADGPAWVAGLAGFECWSVLADGHVLATEGFPRLALGVPLRTSAYRDLAAVGA